MQEEKNKKTILKIIEVLSKWAKEHPLTFMFFGFCVLIIATIYQQEIKQIIRTNIAINVYSTGKVKNGPLKEDSTKSEVKINKIMLNWKETVELNMICEKLRKEYGCTYVNVNAFHNGDSTYNGWHFSKMTCIGEGVAENKPPQLGALKNWHTGAFAESFLEANKNGYIYAPDLTKHKNAYLSHRIPQFGIYSVVYVAILDKRFIDQDGNYHMPGFISFAWDKPTTPEQVTFKTIEAMMRETYQVQKYVIRE